MDPSGVEPVSRTYQYKKVMKPMLERMRRARMNRYLDELKELMVGAIPADGDISKLEKADILELTVRHLHELQRSQDPVSAARTFQAGFGHCAMAACNFLQDINSNASKKLIEHLKTSGALDTNYNKPLSIKVPNMVYSPPVSPISPNFRIRPKETARKQLTPTLHELSQQSSGLLMTVKIENEPKIDSTNIRINSCHADNHKRKSNNSGAVLHHTTKKHKVENRRRCSYNFDCDRKSLPLDRKETMELIRNQILERRQRQKFDRNPRFDDEEEIDVENIEEEGGNIWRPF